MCLKLSPAWPPLNVPQAESYLVSHIHTPQAKHIIKLDSVWLYMYNQLVLN